MSAQRLLVLLGLLAVLFAACVRWPGLALGLAALLLLGNACMLVAACCGAGHKRPNDMEDSEP